MLANIYEVIFIAFQKHFLGYYSQNTGPVKGDSGQLPSTMMGKSTPKHLSDDLFVPICGRFI